MFFSYLLLEHVKRVSVDNPQAKLSLHLRLGEDQVSDALAQCARVKKRRVRRFHTRALPVGIKWSKVFALNIGVHIF